MASLFDIPNCALIVWEEITEKTVVFAWIVSDFKPPSKYLECFALKSRHVPTELGSSRWQRDVGTMEGPFELYNCELSSCFKGRREY